jgi:hypothetical protein
MYAGWNLVPTFIATVFCAQSLAFWPFSVHAATDAPESLFANTNAKRVAVIGMYSSKFHVTSFFLLMRQLLLSGYGVCRISQLWLPPRGF